MSNAVMMMIRVTRSTPQGIRPLTSSWYKKSWSETPPSYSVRTTTDASSEPLMSRALLYA